MSFRIRAIPFNEIVEYISDPAWKTAPVMPITPERARSQEKNPNASPEDTCLWVAEDEKGAVLGFAGSLPAIDVRNNIGMAWNTCWWVDPQQGKDVALPLFFSFLKRWDQHVAFADMTAHTHSIIDQLDFCFTREEKLLLAYVRVPSSKIIEKLGKLGPILSLPVSAVSFLVNKSLQHAKNRQARKDDADLTVSIAHIDEDIYDFIKNHREQDFVHRSLEEYRWLEEYPWLLSDPAARPGMESSYPFSHIVKSFRYNWLISCRKGVIVSVLHISEREGSLKVLSYFGESSLDAVESLSRYVLGHTEIHTLIFSHPDLLDQKDMVKSISLKTLIRPRWVGISKKILDHFPETMVIQLGDGDAAFS